MTDYEVNKIIKEFMKENSDVDYTKNMELLNKVWDAIEKSPIVQKKGISKLIGEGGFPPITFPTGELTQEVAHFTATSIQNLHD